MEERDIDRDRERETEREEREEGKCLGKYTFLYCIYVYAQLCTYMYVC